MSVSSYVKENTISESYTKNLIKKSVYFGFKNNRNNYILDTFLDTFDPQCQKIRHNFLTIYE